MDHGRAGHSPPMVAVRHGGLVTTSIVPAVQPSVIDDDRTVVDAVLGGARETFRVLVDREAASVMRACHRVLGDVHEAEDAAQEAFVTAFQSLAGWRGERPSGAWLTRIANRISL